MKRAVTIFPLLVLLCMSITGAALAQTGCNTVTAGPDQTICAGSAIQLQGNAPGINSVVSNYWTGGNGSFVPNNHVPNPLYYPTPAEIAAGEVNLEFHLTYTSAPDSVNASLLAYDHLNDDSVFYISQNDGSVYGVQSNSGHDLTAIGYQSSTNLLFGISNIVEPANLYEIDVMTNQVNLLISYLGYQYWAGDFDNTHDLFYIIGSTSGPAQPQGLFVFDFSTGAPIGTYLGSLNLPGDNDNGFYIAGDGINGLAYDPNTSKLYGVTFNGKLYDINTSNGNATFIGDCPGGLRGLAFDYHTNTLWGCDVSANLFKIDQNSGALLSTVNCQGTFYVVTSLTYAPGLLPGEQVTCSDSVHIQITDCSMNCASDLVLSGDSCVQTPFVFTVSSDSVITDVLWNFGDAGSGIANTSHTLQGNHTFSAAGTYVVTAVVTLECGSDTLSETVTVIPCDYPEMPTCEAEMPNVFTPNADGINDWFLPKSDCTFEELSYSIFNRWGNLVYTSSGPTDKWNGTDNGKECSEGVYFYLVHYKFPSQPAETVQGMVTLSRD